MRMGAGGGRLAAAAAAVTPPTSGPPASSTLAISKAIEITRAACQVPQRPAAAARWRSGPTLQPAPEVLGVLHCNCFGNAAAKPHLCLQALHLPSQASFSASHVARHPARPTASPNHLEVIKLALESLATQVTPAARQRQRHSRLPHWAQIFPILGAVGLAPHVRVVSCMHLIECIQQCVEAQADGQ